MDLNEMTLKDFEALPIIEEDVICNGLILLPTKRKNDSGYAMFYTCPTFNEKVLGKYEANDIFNASIKNDFVSATCLFSSGLIHMFFGKTYRLSHLLNWLLEQGE